MNLPFKHLKHLAVAMLLTVLRCPAHGPVHEQIAQLDARLIEHPEDASLWVQRADLWRLDGDAERSRRDLETAATLAPGLDSVWWVRARLLAEPLPSVEALPDLDRWLAWHPRHGAALELRARVRETDGDLRGAVSDLTLAIAVAETPGPDLFLVRAGLQRRMGTNHWEEAVRGLDEGLARLGPLVALHAEAADLEQRLGRTDDALRRLEGVARRAPHPETWHARRARLLMSAGRAVEAGRAWESTLAACLRRRASRRNTRAQMTLEAEARSHLPTDAVARIESAAVGQRGPVTAAAAAGSSTLPERALPMRLQRER